MKSYLVKNESFEDIIGMVKVNTNDIYIKAEFKKLKKYYKPEDKKLHKPQEKVLLCISKEKFKRLFKNHRIVGIEKDEAKFLEVNKL